MKYFRIKYRTEIKSNRGTRLTCPHTMLVGGTDAETVKIAWRGATNSTGTGP